SNDGDVTEATYRQMKRSGQYDPRLIKDGKRAALTSGLIDLAFGLEGKFGYGHISFDFLDKGLNGDSWPTNKSNYEPRDYHYSADILALLKKKTLLAGTPA